MLSSLGQNRRLGAGFWGPVSTTAFLGDLQQVPKPAVNSQPESWTGQCPSQRDTS